MTLVGKEDVWRLESKRETEVSEIVTDTDEVEGTYVDSKDEGLHGRGKVSNHRSQRDYPKKRRSKEYGLGRSGRTEFRTGCEQ